MFVASSGLVFFVVFLPVNVFISCQDHDEKRVFYYGFRLYKCIKHRYLPCFIIMFNENSLPHGVPPSRFFRGDFFGFSVWGTVPCYLLHFGTKACTLLNFGAKMFHFQCSLNFP